MKHCNGCCRTLPLDAFSSRRNGKVLSKCKRCAAKRNAAWRASQNAPKAPDPLNIALKQMPGVTGVLVGSREWRRVA